MLDLSKIRYYASALFEVAKEENAEDKIIDNLVLVKFALKTNKELEDYFLNPDIKLEEKKESLKDLLGNNITDYAYNFIFELVEREELGILSLVIERLKVLIYKESGTVEAEITSAFELNNSAKSDILKKIEEKTGKSVKLMTRVDNNLLGGMKVKIGDEMVDLSVKGRLEGLRKSIIG